jgi:hypothetical protein
MPSYTHAAHNPAIDVLVKWTDDGQLVIIGDDSQITDRTLVNLVEGTFPPGWAKAPATPAEIIASVESPTRHTPGPWESNRNGSYWSILGPDRNLNGNGITSVPVAAVVQSNPESLANSRLIAAAPELLRALTEIVSQIDQGGSGGKVFSRDACISAARAAISNANGR